MARAVDEKLLAGDIDKDLFDKFYLTIPKGSKIKYVLSAAANFWVHLSPAAQQRVLADPSILDRAGEHCSGHIVAAPEAQAGKRKTSGAKLEVDVLALFFRAVHGIVSNAFRVGRFQLSASFGSP